MRMEGKGTIQKNRRGALRVRVPGVKWGVPALVTLGTGNVYCMWLPVCFQPLTSPFVSHPLGPTLFTQTLQCWAVGI